jgi:hypothetical protein
VGPAEDGAGGLDPSTLQPTEPNSAARDPHLSGGPERAWQARALEGVHRSSLATEHRREEG